MKTLPASKLLFIAGRYGLYGFMGAEIILLPHIIPEKNAYGDVEYFKSFIVLVPLLLMGFHSGYLRTCYVHQQDLRGGAYDWRNYSFGASCDSQYLLF